MLTLNKKLFRELWQLRMQLLSIALVVAAGVMSVVTMRGAYQAFYLAQQHYYQVSEFADIWSSLVRAPEGIRQRIMQIPGVQQADTRVNFLATLDLPDLDIPAQGRFISVPEFGRPLLNDLRIIRGRYIRQGPDDEAIISEKFADARHLQPGDSIRAVINGTSRELYIVGIASSPEFSYAVPPGALIPEYDRYGIFWMSREILGPAYDMDAAFNEVVVKLAQGANTQAVLQQLDDLLEPYGGLGSYPREDQLSHLVLNNELGEIRIMGTVFPAIFLGIAVFLLHQVMSRLVNTQRGEIAVLKAYGYSNLQTGWHYLQFAIVAVLSGALCGCLIGIELGKMLVALYGEYFEIPGLVYRVTPSLLILATGLTLLGAGSGALAAVYRAVRLPPAEAMRPQAPQDYRAGFMDRLGIGNRLGPAVKFVLRNLERRPLQFLLSVIGIACALSILVAGKYVFDAMNHLMDTQFRQIQREDLTLTFKQAVDTSVRFELQRLPGVTMLETYRMAPARLRNGHLEEEIAVTGIDAGSRLRRVVNKNAEPLPMPARGMVVSTMLAKKLQLTTGSIIDVEWLDGLRLSGPVLVSGITDDYLGLSVWMNRQALVQASGNPDLASGAWLLTDEEHRRELYARLKKMPGIAGVSSPEVMLASFNAEMARGLYTSSAFLLGFAGILAFGVIYNGARISFSERSRELASMRVMGFHRSETSAMLLGEQILITLTALLPGCVLGYLMAAGISTALENDSYRIPLIVNKSTYLLACVCIVLAALLSMLSVRKKIHSMELVSVLKTRE